jgi:hypothetical protein
MSRAHILVGKNAWVNRELVPIEPPPIRLKVPRSRSIKVVIETQMQRKGGDFSKAFRKAEITQSYRVWDCDEMRFEL